MKKKLIVMALALVLLFTVMPPAHTDAATKVPAKVLSAANKAVDDNGICIVIDHKASHMWVLKRSCKTGAWKHWKDFRCTCGDRLRPDEHYLLLRNEDTDQRRYKEGCKTYEYGMYIDRYEDVMPRTVRIHSYAKIGQTTYKCLKKNPNGFGVCVKNAEWLYRNCGDGTAVMGI
jgi:hypothetical protein